MLRFDVYGYPKIVRMSDQYKFHEGIKVPNGWSNAEVATSQEKMTRSKLLNERRKSMMPHISYDLDGDGFVGGRDLVIASLFDKDKDGRLNTIERENALKSLK